MIRGSPEPPRRNSVPILNLPHLDRLADPSTPQTQTKQQQRTGQVALEVLYNTTCEASLSENGDYLPPGRSGVYLAVDPDPRFRLEILAPTKHKSGIKRGYVRLQTSAMAIYLKVDSTAKRLHWTTNEIKQLAKSEQWLETVRRRIADVQRVINETGHLKERLLFSKATEGDGWDPGLVEGDLISIVRQSGALTPKSAQTYENAHGKFIIYRKEGSLRIFRAEGNLHEREQRVVESGCQIVGSPGRKVNKKVPRRLSLQVEALENSHRILTWLHANGNVKYIQAAPTTPRRLVAIDGGEFSVQFCRMYNETDLLALTAEGSRWHQLPIRNKLEICGHFIQGLAFLHQQRPHDITGRPDRIRHGDLKCDNLLVESGETWCGVLGDFDGAQWLSDLGATLNERTRRLRKSKELDLDTLQLMYDIATPSNLLLEDAAAQYAFLKNGRHEEFLRAELARDVWQLGAAIIEGLTGLAFGKVTKEGYPLSVDAEVLHWTGKSLKGKGVPEAVAQVILRMYDPDWIKRWSVEQVTEWYQTALAHCFEKA